MHDDIADDPTFTQLSAPAFRLFVCGLCHASKRLTDGFVPRGVIHGFSIHKVAAAADELITAKLWQRRVDPHNGIDGFYIANWERWVDSREIVNERNERNRRKQARHRERLRAGLPDDDTDIDAELRPS